jgi:hypothetical protein
MSNARLQGNASGTGTVTLESPNTNTDKTINLPDRAGTLSMDGPAFSAYNNTIQTISNSTDTKISLNTELFDTANCFNTSTSRFTPNVAGYYQFTLQVRDNTGGTSGQFVAFIFKNGSTLNFGVTDLAGAVGASTFCNSLVYLNGTTDYVEAYIAQNSGSSLQISQNSASTYFQGFFVRAA